MLIFLDPPSNIVAYNTSSSSINVTWDSIFSGKPPDDNFTGYRVSYREHSLDQEVNYVLCSSADFYTTELTSLYVFTNYCIGIASFTERKVSNTSQCLFITTEEAVPTAPPQNFSIFSTSSTTIGVAWDRLPSEHRRGVILGYKIFYERNARIHRVSRSIESGEQIAEANSVRLDIVGLEKFTNYCVWGVAFNRMGIGNETQVLCISTDEDVPLDSPLNISANSTSSSTIYVQWDTIAAEFIPGILLGFRVYYGKAIEPLSQYNNVTVGTDQLSVDLLNLEASTKYCIQLAGFTRIGDGNRTACFYVTTAEKSGKFIPQPLVEMYYSPTAVKVTWEILNNNRTISGYKLHIAETGSSREPPLAPFEKIIKIQNASQTSLVISNLSIFTRYQIRMAAYSYKEVGDFSFPVIAGTCVCPQYFSVTARPSPLDNGGSRGLTELIAGNIKKSCGFCKEYGETVLNFSKSDEGESSLTFPVSVTTPRGSEFSKFVAILEVPGVVVIRRRNHKSSQGYYEEVITGSFLDKWSFFTVCLLAMYAAGVILWFLVIVTVNSARYIPRRFASRYIHPTLFTSSSGDSCILCNAIQLNNISKESIMLLPIELSEAALHFGSSLIYKAICWNAFLAKKTSDQTDVERSDVHSSWHHVEFHYGIGRFGGFKFPPSTYSTVETLVKSLKEGEVDYVVVDMYIPVKRKDLFNGTWFEIAAFLEANINHGVILQGDAYKLASKLQEMIRHDNVQTNFLKSSEDEEEISEMESKESLFFDPTSPFFEYILFSCLGSLGFLLVCGLLYQVLYRKRKSSQCPYKEDLERTRRDLKRLVDEFYRSISQVWRKMEKKHKQSLLKQVREKREQRKKRSNHC
ncbi:unnamed protein product [Porites lobata]|uniref:Fibronectin type-III domain-containing protein n=1 Tax=Porites lobata TaxID=104759 RepID=A0ABN8QKB3_9CNID|nr:unnamed protein product [Porites lobata]